MSMVNSKKGFYVGDISYVLSDEDYNKEWGEKHNYEDGCYEIEGYSFAVASTAYGDGRYEDNRGNSYGVDAGVIGVVPIELCKEVKTTAELNKYGHFFEGETAWFDEDDGVFTIRIGEKLIKINTEKEDDFDW